MVDEEPEPEEEDDSGPSGFTIARLVFVLVMIVVLAALAASQNSSVSNTPQIYSNPTPPQPDTVNVTSVIVSVPTDACGLSGITPGAFSVPADTVYPFAWWLPWNGAPAPCTITNVTSDTPGFGVMNFGLPLNVSSDGTPLMFQVYCPSSYNGPLALTIL